MEIKNLSSPPLFLADNLALDFINSEYGTGEDRHDCFDDALSIIDWLQTVGLVPEGTMAPLGLLEEARQLRNAARAIVHAAMKSSESDLTVINRILGTGRPETLLKWDPDTQRYRVDVRSGTGSPAGLLWPVADALVKLVTDEKFKYVRQCEAHNCILLFQDLSKSHRRRWCSMATCGNRMKVAAFRNRKAS
ncbi:ABATE domain-containing protein [Enterobacter ludwigii]|jgi:predicted RNA-binding Zn ribbon-like protein|uniref:CGNR zinc finger domain-containing protein n=1 Tax=Enterobacter ludwigii TaxID=299767 RepID=UPI00159C1290|nr:ABATE domain-containing protein [Enterobacter ludwigii]MEA3941149.1 ABATE domain-containing protein [Enterobacter ludwigii]QLA07553.1 ABATE domain-containing protein [Enterobacter ludwigii]